MYLLPSIARANGISQTSINIEPNSRRTISLQIEAASYPQATSTNYYNNTLYKYNYYYYTLQEWVELPEVAGKGF